VLSEVLDNGQHFQTVFGPIITSNPHCINVSGNDEGELLLVVVGGISLPLDRRVESVGVGILEKPRQIGIFDDGLHARYNILQTLRLESPALFRGALVRELVLARA
jgi:hypothetical protein